MTKKYIIPIIIVNFLVGFFALYSHYQTDILYCKQISLILSLTKLNQFKFSYITQSESKNEIYIRFDLKRSRFEDNIDDIMIVRNTITEYLKKHPNNKLNEKKIWIAFYEGPVDELFIIGNYNYFQSAKSTKASHGFNYYSLMSMPKLSSINVLYDAEGISFYTEYFDNTEFLKEMNSLKYLEIRSNNWTNDIKSDIINSFENCKVIYDDGFSFEIEVNE